ncbi:hypothetical protein PC115_g16736 [Phytophthora cactorum]|uniref:Uncharacterized protein n=1 Tax=Phytophthora cactorum TaxID=29920 RepID=A0A8T1B8V6_9STRA|nr:hypothetical protein PC115_g16736 [Phytophthora cactorum]
MAPNAVSQRETSAEVDTWSGETPTVAAWPKVMQFKLNGHLVDSTKSEQCWNRWLAAKRGKTVKLLIYQYGTQLTLTTEDRMMGCSWGEGY